MRHMKSRVELDQEARTMQFEVTGPCLVVGSDEGRAGFHGAVWVFAQPVVPWYDGHCQGAHWMMTPSSVLEVNRVLPKNAQLDPEAQILLCEHSGRLVE